jgi:hypothetical protein
LLIEPQKNIEWYHILLRLDNAQVDNPRFSSEKIESVKASRVSHPPHSPDSAPSDLFLFGYLKEKLCRTSFIARDDLIFVILESFLLFWKWD